MAGGAGGVVDDQAAIDRDQGGDLLGLDRDRDVAQPALAKSPGGFLIGPGLSGCSLEPCLEFQFVGADGSAIDVKVGGS